MAGDGASWAHDMLVHAARRSLRPEMVASATPDDWIALAKGAGANGMMGWLARELRGIRGVPTHFQVQLQGAALRIISTHLALVDDMHESLRILAQHQIDSVVLKGPSLVERAYGDPSLRPYGDIDLYVHPGNFRRALEALEAAGFELRDRNWDFILKDLRGQLHLRGPAGGTIELHWHPINGLRVRRTLGMAPDDLWSETTEHTIAGRKCRVLAPAEELAYLCVHAALHGCNRLLWLLDIALLGAGQAVDWDRLTARLERWRFGAGGYLVLLLARRWADAEIPFQRLGRLRPGPSTRATFERLVGTWDLAEPDRGRRVRELFFATSGDNVATRARLAADFVIPAPGQQQHEEFAGRLGHLRRVTVGTVSRIRSKLAASGSEGSGLEYLPRGDPQRGRSRFLDEVEAQLA